MILIPPSRHVLNSDSILQHLFVKSIDIPFTKNACVRFKTSSVLSLFKKKICTYLRSCFVFVHISTSQNNEIFHVQMSTGMQISCFTLYANTYII